MLESPNNSNQRQKINAATPRKKPMKRILIFITGALLLVTSITTVAAEENPSHFNPKLYNEETLPEGILYIFSGMIDFINEDGVVVDDAQFPLAAKVQVVSIVGLIIEQKDLKKGQKVDVYANDKHKAVYIVVK